MRGRKAGDRGNKEARDADGRGLFPFQPENVGVEFGASKKGEKDRADSRERLHPGLLHGENFGADGEPENRAREKSDDNLDERGRQPESMRNEARDQREGEDQRRLRPDGGHGLHPTVLTTLPSRGRVETRSVSGWGDTTNRRALRLHPLPRRNAARPPPSRGGERRNRREAPPQSIAALISRRAVRHRKSASHSAE